MPVESTKTKNARVRARDQDVPTAWGVYVTLIGLGDIACRTRRARGMAARRGGCGARRAVDAADLGRRRF
jgi:hypothetical protein